MLQYQAQGRNEIRATGLCESSHAATQEGEHAPDEGLFFLHSVRYVT